MVDNQKLAVSGAIAGVATTYLLQWAVMPVLNFLGGFVPAVSLKLADASTNTIAINIRESLTGIEAGLAGWLMDAFGLTVPNNMVTMLLVSAAGGALLFVAGGFVAEMLGMLKGNAVQKTRAVIFTGSVLAALILGTIGLPPELGITLVNVLIAFGVNAAILAWAYGVIDSKAKLGLVPF
jgi:hypothetical protein